MKRGIRICAVVVVGLGLPVASSGDEPEPSGRFTGPWDVAALSELPEHWLGELRDGVRDVWFEGPPFLGEVTPGFAYLGVPECDCESGLPGVVLVHGAGQHASEPWVRYWMARGFAAIAVELQGWGPDGELPGGGPALNADSNFPPFPAGDIRNGGIYHAVADAMLAHSILASQPEVDPARVGVNGLSWGGFLTGIIAGIDDRVKAAAAVYGCGFLHESSFWLSITKDLDCHELDEWATGVDVAAYLPSITCPVLFQTGAKDRYFPPDSYQKSWDLIGAPKTLSLRPRMIHGDFWLLPSTEVEVNLFMDHHLAGGLPAPEVQLLSASESEIVCSVESAHEIHGVFLASTSDLGPWSEREWDQVELAVDDLSEVRAALPETRPLVAFLTVGVVAPTRSVGYFSSPYVFRYGEGSPETIGYDLVFESGGVVLVRGEKPRGQTVVLEGSADACRWVQIETDSSPGVSFEFETPPNASGREFLRVRKWDQVR